jgi:hypothetical protein
MKRAVRIRAAWLSGVAAIALTGCGGGGGGGGGGSSAPPPPPPPSTFGTFSLDTTSLTFTSNLVSTPTPIQVINATATGVTAPTLFIRVDIAGPAVANVTNIIVTSQTTGRADVVPQVASQLGIGRHTSTLTVYACVSSPTCATQQLAGSPVTVNVTYDVRGVAATPASVEYTLGPAPSTADKTRSITVSGHPSPTWTASAAAPWLLLSPTSGDTASANTITATVDETFLAGHENGTYTSQITVTPSVGLPLTVPVTLTLARTQVDFVSPYAGIANTPGDVIIRGMGLAGVTAISFGTEPPVAVTPTSDTEIRVTHPALAAGTPPRASPVTYPITLVDYPAAISKAALVVVNPVVYPAAALELDLYAGPTAQPVAVFYEAGREAIYVAVDGGANRSDYLQLYFFRPGFPYNFEWNPEGQLDLGFSTVHTMAHGRDGETVAFGTENIASQAVLAARTPSGPTTGVPFGYTYALGGTSDYIRSLAIANDGKAILIVANDQSALRSAYAGPSRPVIGAPSSGMGPPLTQLLATGNANPNLFYDGVAGASGDGSLLLLGSAALPPIGSNLYRYDASTGALSDTGIAVAVTSIQLDREGTRALLNESSVYAVGASTLTAQGSLPIGTLAATLSADGTRAYTYDGTQVLRFDVTGPTPVQQAQRNASGSAGDPARRHVMTISPDGQTLFIAGSDSVLVEPVL